MKSLGSGPTDLGGNKDYTALLIAVQTFRSFSLHLHLFKLFYCKILTVTFNLEFQSHSCDTHRLLKAFLLVKHLPECLEDFDTQLLLFIHELLCMFNESDRGTRDVINYIHHVLLMQSLAQK